MGKTKNIQKIDIKKEKDKDSEKVRMVYNSKQKNKALKRVKKQEN
jgi:hypothetical protein